MKEFIDKLIERLEERQNDIAGNLSLNVYYSDGYDKGIEYAIEIANELAEEYKGGWIACSERLPEIGQVVLANVAKPSKYVNKGVPIVITVYEDVYYWRNGTILAWMPLPAPYTEGE